MEGQMDGQLQWQTNKGTDGRGMDGGRNGWMDGWMDGWTEGCMDGERDGLKDGGMNRWRDGQMDGWMEVVRAVSEIKLCSSLISWFVHFVTSYWYSMLIYMFPSNYTHCIIKLVINNVNDNNCTHPTIISWFFSIIKTKSTTCDYLQI